MKMVIEVTESQYNGLKKKNETNNLDHYERAILDSTPLESVIEDIKAEIKDLHKSHMINFVSADGAVDTCLEIIDKHIKRGDDNV